MKALLLGDKKHQFQILFAATIFSCSLFIFRSYYAETPAFKFLIWNLFLAGIPWVITTLSSTISMGTKSWQVLPILSIWLLFFPNAPYILTDIIHIKFQTGMPLWYDLSLILSFAFTGLIAGFYSLQDVEQYFAKQFGSKMANWLSIGLLFLAAFGIYLGRFLRWNSWDIVSNPFGLMADILHQLAHPFAYPHSYAMTLIFGSILVFTYLTFKRNKVQIPAG